MEMHQARYGRATILAPTGRIDHSTSDEFRSLLEPHVDAAAAQSRPVVLDLSGVEYISSAGLRCFMLAAKRAKSGGSAMVVAGLQPVVREIFEISRFTLVFDMFASVRDALAGVDPAAVAAFDRDNPLRPA